MSVRRVFVLWTHMLFYDTLRLLLNHPEIILVGAAFNSREAHDAIIKTHPDTVLFEKSGKDDKNKLMEILAIDNWNLRIIELGLEDNQLNIYHQQHQMVEKSDDLLEILLG